MLHRENASYTGLQQKPHAAQSQCVVKCVFVTKGSKSNSSNIDWLADPSPGQLADDWLAALLVFADYCNRELLVKKCGVLVPQFLPEDFGRRGYNSKR